MFTKNNIPLGTISGEMKKAVKKGRVIPFRELDSFLGKKVLLECEYGGTKPVTQYKVVEILHFLKDWARIQGWDDTTGWKSSAACVCDHIGYTDGMCEFYSAEVHFSNGRFEPMAPWNRQPFCFYELKMA